MRVVSAWPAMLPVWIRMFCASAGRLLILAAEKTSALQSRFNARSTPAAARPISIAASFSFRECFFIQTPAYMKGCEHVAFHMGGPTELMLAGTRFIKAGYQSGGINDSTQKQSYAVLLAKQMHTRFAYP